MNTIIDQLLAPEEPVIRYKARVHLLDEDPNTPEIRQLQNEIKACNRVRQLLSERDADGKIPYHPYTKWYGAHWVLVMLADIDYPVGDDELIPLREQVYTWLFSDERLRSITRHTIAGRTRMCASIVSEKQDTAAYLRLLALALRNYDMTSAIVTDGRGIFYEVKNPRVIETGFRSPQLTLWTLGPDEWLLFLKLPDYAARKKPQRKPDVIQLPLLHFDENQQQEVSL